MVGEWRVLRKAASQVGGARGVDFKNDVRGGMLRMGGVGDGGRGNRN